MAGFRDSVPKVGLDCAVSYVPTNTL